MLHTRIRKPGEKDENIISLLARYRDEWEQIAAEGREMGYEWAEMLAPIQVPVSPGANHASVDIDPRVLGQRIIEARKASGKTQEEVAELLGYSRPTYIAIEKGERPAKPDEIIKLASFFGRKVNELVRPGEPVADFQPHLRAVADRMKPADRPGWTRPSTTSRLSPRITASWSGS